MKSASFVLAVAACLSLVSGSIALVVSILAKDWAKTHLSQSLAKKAIASTRLGTAFSGIFISNNIFNNEFLSSSVVVSAVGYFVWEFVGILAEERGKVDASRIKVLEKNLERTYALLTLLREFVAAKRASIADAVKLTKTNGFSKLGDTKERWASARRTLNPEAQITDLLKRIAALFTYIGQSAGKNTRQGFRVCFYVEDNGYMVEKDSFDSLRQSAAATKSFALPELKHKFSLDNRNDESTIVKSVRSGKMIVISDCEMEENFYFNDLQKVYLKSIVSYPFTLGHDPKRPLRAALVIDTNVAGFFAEEDSGFLEGCLVEFSSRIDLEVMYGELISRKGDDPGKA